MIAEASKHLIGGRYRGGKEGKREGGTEGKEEGREGGSLSYSHRTLVCLIFHGEFALWFLLT